MVTHEPEDPLFSPLVRGHEEMMALTNAPEGDLFAPLQNESEMAPANLFVHDGHAGEFRQDRLSHGAAIRMEGYEAFSHSPFGRTVARVGSAQ